MYEQRLLWRLAASDADDGGLATCRRFSDMMREIFTKPDPADADSASQLPVIDIWTLDPDTLEITFPSDAKWQDYVYKKLLDKQKLRRAEMERIHEEEDRMLAEGLISGDELEKRRRNRMETELHGKEATVLHDWNILPPKAKRATFCAPEAARLNRRASVNCHGPVTWTVEDLGEAGKLLQSPPAAATFEDEQQMRRVYTLIYDVYRYKNILGQCLDDIFFFMEHPDMSPVTSRVWLLLYDLYHRSFQKRTVANAAKAAQIFPRCGLQEVEDTLWSERIKLAAAISRIRIKNKVLRLSLLLPHHLRDEKAAAKTDTPATCWVNIKKVKNVDDLTNGIVKTLNVKQIEEEDILDCDCFKWDQHCPQFVVFHPSVRNRLVQSNWVKKHKLIVQDKSFCLGPATFGKIVSDLQLTGTVIQSHVNSPRTTAYLASLLSQNDNIKKLLAFSAGTRKTEYENYFNDLGIKNILIFSEKMIDLPPDSSNLEEAIAVFATPPNSYSAVTDPIDLVCSRGGDLTMLEVLTETEDTAEGRKRVAGILDEQKQTLRYALSRPQIQFVLYETHSEIEAENDLMVKKTVSEINKWAKIHHASIQGKLRAIQNKAEQMDAEESPDALEDADSEYSIDSEHDLERRKEQLLDDIVVPDCDVFDVPSLPDLCPNMDSCLNLNERGCYLALLQRKQVTRMDNKYMIQMAENRGLFASSQVSDNKRNKNRNKKNFNDRVSSPPMKHRKRAKDVELDRLAIHTHASLAHCSTPREDIIDCPRASSLQKVSQSSRWWAETTRHINSLRDTLAKQQKAGTGPTHAFGDRNNNNNNNKNNSSSNNTGKSSEKNAKRFLNRLVERSQKLDEVVGKNLRKPHSIPIHPKLRLSRIVGKDDNKIPVPITITMVTFPPPLPSKSSSW